MHENELDAYFDAIECLIRIVPKEEKLNAISLFQEYTITLKRFLQNKGDGYYKFNFDLDVHTLNMAIDSLESFLSRFYKETIALSIVSLLDETVRLTIKKEAIR